MCLDSQILSRSFDLWLQKERINTLKIYFFCKETDRPGKDNLTAWRCSGCLEASCSGRCDDIYFLFDWPWLTRFGTFCYCLLAEI